MTKIFAHRGFSSKYPENTMLAFKKAEEIGASGIEIDIQLSKDKEIVICHDEDITRTSNGSGFIKDLSINQLKEFSFHNNFNQYVNRKDTKIPSLEEFFTWLKTNELEINIELKTNIFPYPSLVDQCLEMIEKSNLEDRIILSSFNHQTIAQAKAKNPSIRCGLLSSNTLINPHKYCKENNIEFYHPSYYALEANTFKQFKQAGIGLNIWTVDDKDKIKRLVEEDVYGIITNVPDLGVGVAGQEA